MGMFKGMCPCVPLAIVIVIVGASANYFNSAGDDSQTPAGSEQAAATATKTTDKAANPLPAGTDRWRPVATYSIVARDGKTGNLGVAVQSHWFSVGSVVPWAEPGVGAVATQSLVEVSYGPKGLTLMREGKSAAKALEELTAQDEGEAYRQVAMIGATGEPAAHTGDLCIAHAGNVMMRFEDGTVISVQANMMEKEGVPEAMVAGFNAGRGEFPERLIAALIAAERAGGDIRGRQSAAILVVSGEPTDEPWNEKLVDIRVEDSQTPLHELGRLLFLHKAYQHMDAGDKALEVGDKRRALTEYRIAAQSAGRTEMYFWTGVALANAGLEKNAAWWLEQAFTDKETGDAWRELLQRLPASKLFPDDKELLERFLAIGSDADATEDEAADKGDSEEK